MRHASYRIAGTLLLALGLPCGRGQLAESAQLLRGVRGAVGYVRVMGDGDDGNVIRVAGGVSFGF